MSEKLSFPRIQHTWLCINLHRYEIIFSCLKVYTVKILEHLFLTGYSSRICRILSLDLISKRFNFCRKSCSDEYPVQNRILFSFFIKAYTSRRKPGYFLKLSDDYGTHASGQTESKLRRVFGTSISLKFFAFRNKRLICKKDF